MTKRKAILVDVDGTLVDVSSIRHYVLGDNRNFDAFHNASVDCPPIKYIVNYVNWYYDIGSYDVIIVTARSQKYYPQTAWWLAENSVNHHAIFMRPDNDFRPDYQVKKDILDTIRQKWDVIHCIDDNPQVIALWREEGIRVTVVPGWVE